MGGIGWVKSVHMTIFCCVHVWDCQREENWKGNSELKCKGSNLDCLIDDSSSIWVLWMNLVRFGTLLSHLWRPASEITVVTNAPMVELSLGEGLSQKPILHRWQETVLLFVTGFQLQPFTLLALGLPTWPCRAVKSREWIAHVRPSSVWSGCTLRRLEQEWG